MQIRVDKIFIEEMNKRLGTKITFNEFKSLYKEIKNVRDSDPIVLARKKSRESGKAILEECIAKNPDLAW